MANRVITIVDRIVADSRRSLPRKINATISEVTNTANSYNAKATYSFGPETPIGPFGNWAQTVTVTIEGDDTDPQFQKFLQMYNEQSKNSSQGCYVATAVYGSYDCPAVWTLRRFRDDTLAKTRYGRSFIALYYAISPTLVRWFGKTEWFKHLWKPHLDRLVKKLNKQGVEDTPYNDKSW